MQTWSLARLAEAYGKVGQAEEGLSVLTEALEAAERTAQRYGEAELYRLRGELLLRCIEPPSTSSGRRFDELSTSPVEMMQGEAEADTSAGPVLSCVEGLSTRAQACFRRAIEVARRQQAKSWELRATVSLGRLWQQQGRQLGPENCWRRSTAGSAKGSTRQT